MELVPLKVKILLKPDGNALYPDFNLLPIIKNLNTDWCFYVDTYGDGNGWHYDKVSGHKTDTVDSPVGQQWGMLLLPEEFVDQAIKAFPSTCFEIDEVEVQNFYDTKSHINDPEEIITNEVVQGIKLKQDLGLKLTTQQTNALNPNNPIRGIVKNKDKIWVDHKKNLGITIKNINIIPAKI